MNQLSDSGESREYAYLRKSQSFSAFEIFLSSLGSKLFEKLNFDYSNKFVRFKKCEYMQSNKVVEYFYNVFEKKSNAQIRRKWHIKDKFVLFWIVSKHCQRSFLNDFKMKLDDWEIIASIIGLSRRFVMQKWMCLLRHTTDHFQWSKLEENTLLKYMAKSQYNSKWSELSMKIFEESQSLILRTCKDIRQRWKNYLDPSLKRSKWSKEQDKRLLKLVTSQGKKWSAISRMIPGRTENQVKNRFITLQKKKGLNFEIDDDQESLKQNPVIGELKQQYNEVDLNISQKQEDEFILSGKLKFEYQGKDIISDNNTYVGSEEYFINQVLRENNYVYKELYEE